MDDCTTDKLSSDQASQEDMANKFQAQLNSKKPFDKIFALGKIASILRSYEKNEMNIMDKKLVTGFYSKNLNDYGYLARGRSKRNKKDKGEIVQKTTPAKNCQNILGKES